MEIVCCIRGCLMYVDVWEASIGEELDCQRKPSNANGPSIAVDSSEDERGPAGSESFWIPLRLNRHVVQQSHGSKSHFTSTPPTNIHGTRVYA